MEISFARAHINMLMRLIVQAGACAQCDEQSEGEKNECGPQFQFAAGAGLLACLWAVLRCKNLENCAHHFKSYSLENSTVYAGVR
jgi:hypothetical protein